MKPLTIATDLALPIDAATQTFAFIARKGAGKTYAAGKLVELLVDAGVQVVILDTVGNWYGLRLGADGKARGFDIPVLGGLRGDIPLEAAGGELIANIVVETGRSLIVDMSQFSLEDRRRFATAFGRQLWQRKKGERHPSPLHLVIEESQLLVPQHVAGNLAVMYHQFEEIIRLGRNYGIGVSMITQRPQSVNKEVLNQTECLFVGQVNGAQERDALKKWITHQGMDVHLVDELPALKIGTFYVWSPQWLGLLQKVQILPKRTFDASATPKVGDRQVRRELKPLDLTELQTQMAATIERAKADDPRELRKRISELERQLKAKRTEGPKTQSQPVEVLTDADRALLTDLRRQLEADREALAERADLMLSSIAAQAKAEIDRALGAWLKDATGRRDVFAARLEKARVQKVLDKLDRVATAPTPAVQRHTIGAPRTTPRPSPAASPAGTFQRTPATGSGDTALNRMQRAMLTALAQHPDGLSKKQILIHTGYASSGPVSTAFADLVRLGAVSANGYGLRLTDHGVTLLGDYEPLPTGDALREWLLTSGKLSGMEAALLRAVCAAYPQAIRKGDVLEQTGYASSGPVSSAFAKLVGLNYVRAQGPSRLIASEALFS